MDSYGDYEVNKVEEISRFHPLTFIRIICYYDLLKPLLLLLKFDH